CLQSPLANLPSSRAECLGRTPMASAVNHPRAQRSFAPPLVLLAICVLINYVDRGNLSLAAPIVQSELGLSNSELGLLLGAFFWSYMAMQFVVGWLVDRFEVTYRSEEHTSELQSRLHLVC